VKKQIKFPQALCSTNQTTKHRTS